MKRVKNRFYDKTGDLLRTEYYADGEFEALEAERAHADAVAECLENRRKAYTEKWPDPFDVFDDMTKRGVDTVLAERQAIKELYPKPVKE
jgi:hypothetical protein